MNSEQKERMRPEEDTKTAARLATAFPTREQVPAEFRFEPASYERLFLLEGQIRSWVGPLAEVSSPICLNENGVLKRPVIGRVPLMDQAAGLAALESAVRAWDHGRGRWPTSNVMARIEVVDAFVTRMLTARDEVVKLLMWEIG
ncbi:MAG TPA: hypothetical protein VJA21_30125, partial [Verrucomicrobiae bacterium]